MGHDGQGRLSQRRDAAAAELIQQQRGNALKNPWLKKNPFLSMWMSGANAVMGAARSRATAEGKRQAATMMSQAATHAARFWSNPLMMPRAKRKKAGKKRT